ncbi:MAG: hypothetical protein JJ975_11645 [Bacteroidia bacterium]|nr:hypothetical protein [Bacteroidia bacterium]
MKNLKYLLIAMMIAPMFFVGTGCGGDEVPPVKDTTPTVDPTDTASCGFTVSFDNYQLVLEQDVSGVYYDNVLDKTTIEITGFSTKNKHGATITSKAEISLEFNGKATGKYDQNSPGLDFKIATGEGVQLVESSSDPTNNLTINITEYGEKGELIKGTFSGKLKTGINSRDFTKGYFNIVRKN